MILLVYDIKRRGSIREEMRQMTEVLSQNVHPCKQTVLRGQRVAIPLLGDQHRGSFTIGSQKKKVCHCWNRLFHQMGQSRGVCKHNAD